MIHIFYKLRFCGAYLFRLHICNPLAQRNWCLSSVDGVLLPVDLCWLKVELVMWNSSKSMWESDKWPTLLELNPGPLVSKTNVYPRASRPRHNFSITGLQLLKHQQQLYFKNRSRIWSQPYLCCWFGWKENRKKQNIVIRFLSKVSQFSCKCKLSHQNEA